MMGSMGMLGQTDKLSLKRCTGGEHVEGDWVPVYETSTFKGAIQPATDKDTLMAPESWRAAARWKIYTHKELKPVVPEQQQSGDQVTWYNKATSVTRQLLVVGGRDYKTTPQGMLLGHYKYVLAEQQVGGVPS